MQQPKVPYACVASPSGVIVVERSLSNGNASDICSRILQRLPRKPDEAGKKTYTMGAEGFTFRLAWKADGHTFAVLERGLGDQMSWKLLNRIRQRWEEAYGDAVLVDVTTTAARPFATVLSELLAEPTGANEELGAVNQRLEDVRNVMHDSIEKVLERGDKIDLLVDRADRLERNATTFAKSSNALRRQYRWRNIRCYVMMGAACCVGVVLLAMSSCGGPTLSECRMPRALGGSASSGLATAVSSPSGAGGSDAGFEKVDSN